MKKIASMFFAVSAIILVSGCSGSDSTPPPSTLTGTAATGLPIDGTVYVKDAKGVEKSIATAADGSFTLDVPGMTPPYLLKITPSSGPELYSFASKNGQTVNLTPATDLAMFLAYGRKDLNTLYVNWDGAAVTATAVDTAEGVVRANLKTQMQAASLNVASFDLFTTPFKADSKGIDGVMDGLKIAVDASTGGITFTDLSGNGTFDDTLTPPAPPAPPAPGNAISVLTVKNASYALNGTYKTACYLNDLNNGEIDSLVITGATWLNSSVIYAGANNCSGSPTSTNDITATVTKNGGTKTVTWVDGMGNTVNPKLAADNSTSMVGTTVTLLNLVVTASYDTTNIPVDAQFTGFYVIDDTVAGSITMYRDDDELLGLVSTIDPYVR